MPTSVHDLCVGQQLSLDDLSRRAGLELARVQAIYLGRWTPSPTERLRIAVALGVSPDEVTWGHATPIQHIYGHGPS